MPNDYDAKSKLFDDLAEWAHSKMGEQLKSKYAPKPEPTAAAAPGPGELDAATLATLKSLVGGAE